MPGRVTVWSSNNSIYIIDAALDVKLESEYLELKGYEQSSSPACPPSVDPILQKYAEDLFRQMILPKVIEKVNTAPEYQNLRTIFNSRIVVEWYKNQHATNEHPIFFELIDQGNTANWQSDVAWNKQNIYDRYVRSVSKGEFNITRQSQQGNIIYTRTYFYGGVDFSTVPITQITYSDLIKQIPEVEQPVLDALFTPLGHWSKNETWLGGQYNVGSKETEIAPFPTAVLSHSSSTHSDSPSLATPTP